MSESEYLVSICIPAYKSPAALFALLDSLLACARSDFEIVVSDDCSAVDCSWGRLAALSARDSRLRCARNDTNLGMDRNFARAVELAHGRYAWLCGQDDMILTEGLDRVLGFLESHPEVDFIFFDHTQRIENAEGDRFVPGSNSEAHVFGHGLSDYLAHTHYRLPTFLPTYLMRTELWRSVDVSRYYGTCYCQVGVFLEVSRDIRWCHFAGCHVVGLIPADGWQSNPLAYVRIAFGYVAMLARVSDSASWVTSDMVRVFLQMHKRSLIYSFLLIRHYRLCIAPALVHEASSAIQLSSKFALPIAVICRAPRHFSSLVLGLIKSRRALRALLRRQ